MGTDTLNHAIIRADDRWTQNTLRQMGVGGGHLRPGPQRRAEHALFAFCIARASEWWVAMAQDRKRWQLHELAYVRSRRGATRAEQQWAEVRAALSHSKRR